MMQIRAEDLKMNIGGTEILKGVSIGAGDGGFIGVIGPNGSGKSTLLKCIYRVLNPTKGEVSLNGKPLHTYSFKESAREMAVVAQHNYYNFEFSVRDVVLMGRSPHKRAMERDNAEDFKIVDEALEKVGMLPFKDRSFSTLSGGEQQRVILARALAQKTNCLILDEPTNHLDMESITALNNGLIKFPGVLMFASHDHQFVQTTANRIMEIMPGGALIDKITSYDEYLASDEMARKRQVYTADASLEDN